MKNQLESELANRKEFLEKVIAQKQEAVSKAPEGDLRINHHGKHAQFYCRKDPKDTCGKYIKAKDRQFAVQLAQKDYDRKVLKYARKELSQLTGLIKTYGEGSAESVFEKMGESRRKLICPVELPDDLFVEKWLECKYEKKGFAEDAPDYYTARGERVRSKSEIIIADTLNRMHIPYRYEYPLKLIGMGTVYPDFTVLNVRLRRVYYWEHLGMMDDLEYSSMALQRIDIYERNGFFPGSSLILSHETSFHPISTRLIEEMISHYLL